MENPSDAPGVTPPLASATLAMPGAIYSPFADQSADQSADLHADSDSRVSRWPIPLHVGDTWRDPFVGARAEDLKSAAHPRLHAYGDTRGLPALVDAVIEKLASRNGARVGRDEVLITAGATGGLSAVVGAIVEPGDEVMILAPFWPLIRGIVQTFRGRPVEVPFFDRVSSAEEAVAAVEAAVSSRTRALYVSTPSNPTGRILPPDWLEALAHWARKRGLWLLSDEVYEDYHYRGEHVSLARFAPERTLSVYSFSKSYAMAGTRVGYLVGPAEVVHEARKIGTHLYYHAPTSGQQGALAALEGGRDWLEAAVAEDRDVGRAVVKELGLAEPEGGTFLFLDVSSHLDDRGLHGFLADCFDRGVLLAPGQSCGEAYSDWVRISYTAAPPQDVLEATRRIGALIGAAAADDRV